MILIMADADGSGPLLISGLESAQCGTKLLDLPAVLRPVARPLGGDRPIVVGLRLTKQIADRA
jgi:hypothetical protein